MFVINKGMCVSCHNCASECPRQAIDFVGTKYEIDQEKMREVWFMRKGLSYRCLS